MFSVGVRQVSNTRRHLSSDMLPEEYSPKVNEAFKRLEKGLEGDSEFKAVVYSNFLEAGIKEYANKLKSSDIPYSSYTGESSKAEKDEMVKNYNSGKVPVLLISSSGAEGLDLKGTRLTQVLEPHFNKSKIKQVMGRGARYESHTHLPEEDRNMKVEHFISTYPESKLGKTPYSIDKYLSENSDTKDELFDKVKDLMRKNRK